MTVGLDDQSPQAAPLASFSSVPPGETFDLVIGADVLYEWPMAVTLPTVVKNRIASPHGKCVILNAIRFPDMSDFLIENFGKAGLDVQCETIECEQVSNMKMGPVRGERKLKGDATLSKSPVSPPSPPFFFSVASAGREHGAIRNGPRNLRGWLCDDHTHALVVIAPVGEDKPSMICHELLPLNCLGGPDGKPVTRRILFPRPLLKGEA